MAAPGHARARALQLGVTLTVDAASVRLIAALQDRGVRSLVLRGPGVAQWLYGDASPRDYRDLDLLVLPAQRPAAEGVLLDLGFHNRFAGFAPGETVAHASEWTRPDPPMVVDLHRTLEGVHATPEELWRRLAAGAVTIDVADGKLPVPSEPARAFIVALHAAHHGVKASRPLTDLSLALERLDEAIWVEAEQLASVLDARASLSAGLRLLPAGAVVADRLGLPAGLDPETSLRASSASSAAIGFARLASTPGISAKVSTTLRKLFPTPSFMRHWSRLARRGAGGLALAYAWRPLWLLLQLGPAAVAWRRARK